LDESGPALWDDSRVHDHHALQGRNGQTPDEPGEPDDYRLKSHADQLPDELQTLIFHETTATEIDNVDPIYIPGVTQTEEYARALFWEGGLEEPAKIEECVRIRMIRHEILTKYNPPQCTFHVHENVLRVAVGGPQVMYEQMLFLLFLGPVRNAPSE
jgi:hypothetical protein